MIPKSFTELLPKVAHGDEDLDPLYYLWVYDPDEDKAHVVHNEGRHRADYIDHEELGRKVVHPERVHGYAYPIGGGFRITDWDHRPVDDPHIAEVVRRVLKGERRHSKSGSVSQLRALR